MAGPPAGPPFLRPGWVSQRPPQVWPAQPALPDRGRLRHKHKHRMCLACRLFAARPEENRGKLLSKLHGPSETMWGTKFSREPGRARASQPWAFVPGPEREQCPAARLEAGFGPIPQFGPLEPPGGGRRPVALGGKWAENPGAPAGPAAQPSCCLGSAPLPLGECGQKGGQELLQARWGRRPLPGLGVSFPQPSPSRAEASPRSSTGGSARPPCLGPSAPDAGPSSSLLHLVSRSAPARRPGLSWPRH